MNQELSSTQSVNHPPLTTTTVELDYNRTPPHLPNDNSRCTVGGERVDNELQKRKTVSVNEVLNVD
jgi:hypothetical protein